MTNILEQYYRGITQQLRAEIDSVNSQFHHQGLKGQGNESALRALITKFIPKRYGVGTGVVIDRAGNQSRQSDIVIYDTHSYPALLSLTEMHMFPVDTVYATIEVKTTLDSNTSKESLENIESVRRLNVIPGDFNVLEEHNGGFAMRSYSPTPPFGFIFAYNSSSKHFETFRRWFTANQNRGRDSFPKLVGCLDQGLLDNASVIEESAYWPLAYAYPLLDNEGEYVKADCATKFAQFNGHIYPVKQIMGECVLVDQSRVLLQFLLLLNEILAVKRLNPNLRLLNTFLREANRHRVIVPYQASDN